jgi:hypothetical protein
MHSAEIGGDREGRKFTERLDGPIWNTILGAIQPSTRLNSYLTFRKIYLSSVPALMDPFRSLEVASSAIWSLVLSYAIPDSHLNSHHSARL